jgi:hypothetical protein
VKFAVNGVFLIEGNEPEVHKGIRYKTLRRDDRGVWGKTPQAFREPQDLMRGAIEDDAADDAFMVIRAKLIWRYPKKHM